MATLLQEKPSSTSGSQGLLLTWSLLNLTTAERNKFLSELAGLDMYFKKYRSEKVSVFLRPYESFYETKVERFRRDERRRVKYAIKEDYLSRLRQLDVELIRVYWAFPEVVMRIPVNRLIEVVTKSVKAGTVDWHISRPMQLLLNQSKSIVKIPEARSLAVQDGTDSRFNDVRIGLIDSGVEQSHPDLTTASITAKTMFQDTDLHDYADHGTPIAGILVGQGAAQVQGILPEATLLSYKVCRTELDIGSHEDEVRVTDALQECLNDEVDIINVSWGFEACEIFECSLCRKVNAVANAGIAIVAASGDTQRYKHFFEPAQARYCYAVSVTDKSNNLWPYNPIGPARNGVDKPEVVAPGIDIISTSASGPTKTYSGSSFAAPHVVGAIAIARAKRRRKPGDQQYIRTVLQGSAMSLTGDALKEGAGLLNAEGMYSQF